MAEKPVCLNFIQVSESSSHSSLRLQGGSKSKNQNKIPVTGFDCESPIHDDFEKYRKDCIIDLGLGASEKKNGDESLRL